MSNSPQPTSPGYRSILVHVDANDGAADRVRLAADLADNWDALLIGAAAIERYLSLYGDGTFLSPGLLEEENKGTQKFLAAAHSTFEQATESLPQTAWHTELWNETSMIVHQARRADLIVLGRRDVLDNSLATLSEGEVIVSAGRPVLVVPPHVDALSVKKVVIGWKDTREIRRAISDALPLLRMAEEVIVLAVSETLDGEAWADIQSYLARYGLPCSFVYRRADEADSAATIMDVARELGAGLIVTGGYGRRRLSEWLFGGVTRDLLSQSPVCCLMSH